VCPPLPAPTNGRMRCQFGGDGNPNPGDSCRFECDTGFTLQGRDQRTCRLQNGVARWTGNNSDNAMCVKGMEFAYAPKDGGLSYLISVVKRSISNILF